MFVKAGCHACSVLKPRAARFGEIKALDTVDGLTEAAFHDVRVTPYLLLLSTDGAVMASLINVDEISEFLTFCETLTACETPRKEAR